MGRVGGLGVVALLVGVPGRVYALATASALALGIWITGETLVDVLIP